MQIGDRQNEHKNVVSKYGFICDEGIIKLIDSVYEFYNVYGIKYDKLTFMSCQHDSSGMAHIRFHLDAFKNLLEFLKNQCTNENTKFSILYDEFFSHQRYSPSSNIDVYMCNYNGESGVFGVFGDVWWKIPQSKIQYFTDEFNKLISNSADK